MTSEWWCQTGKVFWVMSDGNWMMKKMDPNTTLTTLPNRPKFLSLSPKKKKKSNQISIEKENLGRQRGEITQPETKQWFSWQNNAQVGIS